MVDYDHVYVMNCKHFVNSNSMSHMFGLVNLELGNQLVAISRANPVDGRPLNVDSHGCQKYIY